MSRNDKFDERDWRRQRQDWQEQQDRWSRDRREDEYGWTGQGPEGRYHRGPEMESRWREQGRQDRGWDPDWQNWSEPYQGLGGRGWRQGINEAMHRGEGRYAGRGPRGYQRADNRIEEDINERLTQHSMIDATDVEVTVQNGEVTLRGHVDDRWARRLAEDIAENVFGVKEVNNQIKVKQRDWEEGKQRKAG